MKSRGTRRKIKIREDMQPAGCSIISKNISDAQDAEGKWFREITTVEKCRLVLKTVEGRLTKEVIEGLIKEELKLFLKKKNNNRFKDLNDTERKDALMPGYADLKSLASGIYEEEEELEEACEDHIPGNRTHSDQGTFASLHTNKSWSLQDKGCGANKMTPGSKQRRWTKIPCGRAARRKGKNIRCHDGRELPMRGGG